MKIEAVGVSKKYRNRDALHDVSFTLKEPKIYGLLGRNGAGKTTFMEILAGHQLPTKGTIRIDGEPSFDNDAVLEQICLIKEGENFFKDIKVKDVLKTYELIFPTWDSTLAEELMNVYCLPDKARVKTLSKGMASALGIIVGLASRAPVTIFDEPYIGLDAAGRKRFYEILLEEYETCPRTFILSTHLIDEVSRLFEEVLIIQNGKLILKENTEAMREKGFTVTGEAADVKQYIQGKQVIKTKELANMMTAYVYGEKEQEDKMNLSFEGIPIQDLMVYLTEEKEEQTT